MSREGALDRACTPGGELQPIEKSARGLSTSSLSPSPIPLLPPLISHSRNFYNILGVPRGAADAQIKRAYRKLALQYHPDKVSGSEADKAAAATKFADINAAYETLSSEETRRIYDRYGEEGVKQHAAQGGGGGGGGGGFGRGPQDIFSQFFGFGGGFGGDGGGGEPEARRGAEVRMPLEVRLEDLYTGAVLGVTRVKLVLVPAAGTRKCACRARVVTRQLGPGMYQQFTTEECDECPAVAFEPETKELSVTVAPGARPGEEVRFFEEGEPEIDGDPGDLVLVLDPAPHALFARAGDDLAMNATISLAEALVGFDRTVPHLDGHPIRLAADGVTRPGAVVVVPGEGMPRAGKLKAGDGKRPAPPSRATHGDLHVTYTVSFPRTLTDKQKAVVREHFRWPAGGKDEL